MSGRRLDLSVYLVLDGQFIRQRELLEILRAAVAGGVTAVQLRDKQASQRTFLAQARKVQAALKPLGVPLIINDRLDVALAIGADGVHLGQDDADVHKARRLLGPEAHIGLSISRPGEVTSADPQVIDYVGLGPIFPTGSKRDTAPPLGLAGVQTLRARLGVPIVAIGGIGGANAESVIAAGADGVAAIASICAAPDPQVATQEIAAAVRNARRGGNR